MQVRLTHWTIDGNHVQYIPGEDEIPEEHSVVLDDVSPSYLAGITACPFGIFSPDDGDSVLKVEFKEGGQWVQADGWELFNTYHSHIRMEEGADEEPGDLLVSYDGYDALWRGMDDDFMKGLKWYRDNVEHNVQFVEINENGRFLTPAEEYNLQLEELLAQHLRVQ